MNAHNGKDNGRPPAIVVDKLTKKFGNFTADDALEFTVRQGEIFGILGPNGAGKSTLIRMLNTLLVPTSGRATVMGFDVARETAAVRHEIGVIPQANTVDGDLTAWESMDIYGKFYGMSRRERQQRATQLLEAVGLTEWKDKAAGTFSGGMRRRLEIARGLIHRPHVFILDEPTTGLDPQSRRVIWELLERLRGEGDLTILLCTHYMDEADRLCDLLAALKGLPEVHDAGTEEPHVARLILNAGQVPLEGITEISRTRGNRVQSITLLQPSLEDVFIHYTGRGLRDAAAGEYTYAIPSMMR